MTTTTTTTTTSTLHFCDASTAASSLLVELHEILLQRGTDPRLVFAVALTLATDMAAKMREEVALPCDAEFTVAEQALNNLWNAFAQRGLWRNAGAVSQLQYDFEIVRPIL